MENFKYNSIHTTLQVFAEKMPYEILGCIISLHPKYTKEVIPYDKLIIQRQTHNW